MSSHGRGGNRGGPRGGGGGRGGRGGRGGGGRGGFGRGGGYHGPSNAQPVSYDDDAFFAGTPYAGAVGGGGAAAGAPSAMFPLSYQDTSSFQLPGQQSRPTKQHNQQQHHQHQQHHAAASSSSSSSRHADGYGSDLIGDDADRAELASMPTSAAAAVLMQRAEARKQAMLLKALNALAPAALSSGKTFVPHAKPAAASAAKPKTKNANPNQRAQHIEFKDDLEADAAAAAAAGHSEDSEDDEDDYEDEEDEDYEDDDDHNIYNDEDNIFDYEEQSMLDAKQQKAAKQLAAAKLLAQQQGAGAAAGKKSKNAESKHVVVTKKEKLQQQNQQQAAAPSVFAPAPAVVHDDGLTHSQRRALRKHEKAQAAAAANQQPLHGAAPAAARPAQAHVAASPVQAPRPSSNNVQHTPHRNNNNTGGGTPFRSPAPASASATPHRGHYANGRAFFPEHLPLAVMEAGVRSGVYVRGILRIVGSNAFVSVPGLKTDVFIQGRKDRNRGFDGDEVCVQIIGSDTGLGSKQQRAAPVGGAAQSTPQRKFSANNNNANSNRKQSKFASLEASLANLIVDSERKEDEKMAAEQLTGTKPGKKVAASAVPAAAAPVVAEVKEEKKDENEEKDDEEEEDEVTSNSTLASAAYLAQLSSAGPDVQHKGVVVGIMRAKFTPLHAPGLLKPYSNTLALFVPLDRKTPFAMLAERHWPEGFAKEYRKYLSEEKGRKEAKALAMRARKETGNFPLSAENSSEVVVEHEEALAKQAQRNAVGASSASDLSGGEEADVDAMTAASDPSALVLDPHVYVATYQPWLPTDRQPFCSIRENLGLSGTITTETEALLIANGVDYDLDGAFGQEVLAEVASYGAAAGGWKIPEDEIARRRDMRDQTKWRIVTIDPTTARDLDDAIHILDLGDDVVEIGVHIADVSYFVKPGTKLDEEARHRATTIYLVNKAIPMLPPILCQDLCSLNPDQDRLAYSTVFFLSKSTGKLLDRKPWFGRTVIRTCCRLNYETAQELMEFDLSAIRAAGRQVVESDLTGELAKAMAVGHPYRPVEHVTLAQLMDDMQLLHAVSMRRRADRFVQGSLTLSNVKLQFVTDAQRNPTGFYTYVTRDSNRVVEECMLLANMVVAHQCVQFCKSIALLRRHPPPNEKAMQRVSQACAELGFDIDASSSGALQKSLSAYEGMFVGAIHGVNDDVLTPGTVPVRHVLEPLCTKPMQLAQYFCTGTLIDEPAQWAHYALHFAEYTHFTSPIRRYADVIVHRVLSFSLELEAWTAKKAAAANGEADAASSSSGLSKRAAIGSGRPRPPASLSPDEVVAIAEQCNTRKANAKKAQEASSKVYLCDYLLKFHASSPLSASAVLIDMVATEGSSDPTFDIMLPHLGLEKKIHLNDLIKQGKITSAEITPEDPPQVGRNGEGGKQGGGFSNKNNQQSAKKNKKPAAQSAGTDEESSDAAPAAASSSSASSSSATPASLALASGLTSTALAPKSAKRLRVTWLDGSSNTYSIFESIDVELAVKRGPPMDVDAFVISPATAKERQSQTKAGAREEFTTPAASAEAVPLDPDAGSQS